jgi:rubrerythrin
MAQDIATTAPPMLNSMGEFLAHAFAIEREAIDRYLEFADRMSDMGNERVAAVFERLAIMESGHLNSIRELGSGTASRALDAGAYAWLGEESPEAASREWLFRLMTPWDALQIALRCEYRARDFFRDVAATTSDAQVRRVASEMMQEESEHVEQLKDELTRHHEPLRPWNEDLNARP